MSSSRNRLASLPYDAEGVDIHPSEMRSGRAVVARMQLGRRTDPEHPPIAWARTALMSVRSSCQRSSA